MKFLTDLLFNRENSGKKDLSILLLVFGISYFQFLGRIPLIDPDEARYAEVPREMLERWDFITPLFNYTKFFDKPPLHYWLSTLSMTVFGQNEFAARFTGAAMGLLTVLLTYHAGRRLFGRREGFLAALILGASTGFLVLARYNITDMTLTCTLSATLFFFILAADERETRKGLYYHLFYLCAALAVLAKGLIGIVFPGAVIFLYFLTTRRWRLLREMRLLTGIPLFLLVCAPWFILVSLKNPEFPGYFFIHEHFERFTSTVHNRKHGIWFYLPVLAGAMLPWSVFLPASFQGLWRERPGAAGAARLYLFIWAAFIFVFFSISSSQLVPYILPVFPPLALLAGSACSAADAASGRLRGEGYCAAGLFSILGAATISYPHLAPHPYFSAAASAVIGSILLCGGIIAFRHTARRALRPLFASLLICSYAAGIVGPSLVLAKVADERSSKELARIINANAGKETVLASMGLERGLPFYTRRRVVTVGGLAELEFGSRQGDQSAWFPDLQGFAKLWDSGTPVLLVIPDGGFMFMEKTLHKSPRTIARCGGKLLIANY
ncbi:MAG TPA: glycosyltransferase family 39 protein [Geobacteraceae bacterium]|nr:glycosyltransferase family 39 protein [Geobacteraceae bacterium]